jgi:hypothetical protein
MNTTSQNNGIRKFRPLGKIKHRFSTTNGYDPNKAIPDQERISKEKDFDNTEHNFNAPGELQEDKNNRNDEFDNPSDESPLNDEIYNPSYNEDFTESDEDLQELDPDEDDLEDDLEEDEIEEEDYTETDPLKL